jgi:hypothetical protein
MLMKCGEFSSLYYQRHMDLQNRIQNLYQDNGLGTNQIDNLSKEYGGSFERDVKKWPVDKYRGSELYRAQEKTYTDSVSFLRSFLKNRNEWLVQALSSYKPSAGTAASAGTAMQTASPVLVDGNVISFEAYNINGNNYFKLRDLAKAISGSRKQFEVVWDAPKGVINLEPNKPYTSVGGELRKGDGSSKKYTQGNSRIYKGGQEVSLTAYNIGGNNYVKLRDIAALLDIGVVWDSATSTIKIDTNTSYSPQ